MNYLLSMTGALGLIFKLWLTEFKLRDELQFRRHYLSRTVNYHLFIAMTLGFESVIFNSVIFTCFPVMILTTVWDYNFYKNFRHRTYWEKNRGWLVVERLLLHPPILAAGLWIYLSGIETFIPRSESFFPYMMAMLLVFVPFFVFDERWASKYNWPQALIMIVLMVGATVVIVLVGVFVVYQIDFAEVFARVW